MSTASFAWQCHTRAASKPRQAHRKRYRLWACISQFDAATGADAFRSQTSFRKERYWWTSGDNAFFTGDEAQLEDVVAGDIVALGVRSLGSFSYDTQIGGNTTAPLFEVVSIKPERGTPSGQDQ